MTLAFCFLRSYDSVQVRACDLRQVRLRARGTGARTANLKSPRDRRRPQIRRKGKQLLEELPLFIFPSQRLVAHLVWQKYRDLGKRRFIWTIVVTRFLVPILVLTNVVGFLTGNRPATSRPIASYLVSTTGTLLLLLPIAVFVAGRFWDKHEELERSGEWTNW